MLVYTHIIRDTVGPRRPLLVRCTRNARVDAAQRLALRRVAGLFCACAYAYARVYKSARNRYTSQSISGGYGSPQMAVFSCLADFYD